MGIRNKELYALKKEVLSTKAALQRFEMQFLLKELPRSFLGGSLFDQGTGASSNPTFKYTRWLWAIVRIMPKNALLLSAGKFLLSRLPIPKTFRAGFSLLATGLVAMQIWKRYR